MQNTVEVTSASRITLCKRLLVQKVPHENSADELSGSQRSAAYIPGEFLYS